MFIRLIEAPVRAATVNINGADQAIAIDPSAAPAITFTTDNIAFIDDGVDISSNGAGGATTITAGTAGFGTLVFSGTTTVNGTIGSGTAIGTIIGGEAGTTVTIGGGGAGTVNMTGVLWLNDTGTITIGGALTNFGTVMFANDGTLNVNGASSWVAGSVTTGTDLTGTLVVGGTGSSFVSDIGDSGARLARFQLNNAGTTTVSGNVYAPVEFSADGTLNLAATKSITGAVTTTAPNTGTLTFAGSTAIVDQVGDPGVPLKTVNFTDTAWIAGDVFATNVNITAGTALLLDHRIIGTAGGGINLSGTSTLALGTYTLINDDPTGDLNIANIPTMSLTLSPTQNTSGQVVLTGGGTSRFNNTGLLIITPAVSNTPFLDGQIYNLVSGGSAAATGGTLFVDDGGRVLLSWTARVATAADAATGDRYGGIVTANNDVVLEAELANASSVSGIPTPFVETINAINTYSGTDSNVQSVQIAMQALTSVSDVNSAGLQLAPDSADGSVMASLDAAGEVARVIAGRGDNQRLASSGVGTGVSTGEAMKGLDIWGQAFGSETDQQSRDYVDGYDAETFGGVIGVDFRVGEDARLGIAGSYAVTEVNDKNSPNGTSVDSYGGTVYLNWLGDPWYLDTKLGYTRHAYAGRRYISFPGFSAIANSDYQGNQYAARVDAGYPLRTRNLILTPNVSLALSRVDQDSYTETGGNGSNLTVDDVTYDSARTGLGLKAGYVIHADDGKFIPEMSLTWMHEYMDPDAPDITSSFAGGTKFEVIGMEQPRDSWITGAALNYLSGSDLELAAKYDSESRTGFKSHIGRVQMKYHF